MKQLKILSEMGFSDALENNTTQDKGNQENVLEGCYRALEPQLDKMLNIRKSTPIYCKSCGTPHNIMSDTDVPTYRCIKCGFFLNGKPNETK